MLFNLQLMSVSLYLSLFLCRLSPMNMPDYAEVACSTFKSPHNGSAAQTSGHPASSLYDSCGAYATTNVVANVKLYQNRYGTKPTTASTTSTSGGNNNNGSMIASHNDYQSTGMYSAPASAHYGCLEPMNPLMTTSTASTAIVGNGSPAKLKKINITENKLEHLQNLSNKNERTNPFNQQQQLLLASNALKQGLGAYANTTLAAQMASGGGAGTLRRQRQPKTLFKSETNILGKSMMAAAGGAAAGMAGTGGASRTANNTLANGNLDFLTGGPAGGDNIDADFSALCNSTNQLLNDWASSASIAAGDYHFGSKQPSKQHLYVKAKDGTWSAVSSEAYQTYKQQQQQQQQPLSGDNNKPINPAHSSSSLAPDSKFLSSFGASANV